MCQFLSTVFLALISTTLSGSIMAMAFLFISPKLDRRFQPRVKVLLWDLICLRFLLFMRISIPIPAIGMRRSEIVVSAIDPISVNGGGQVQAESVVKQPSIILYVFCFLSILWILATVIIFSRRLWEHYTETQCYLRVSAPADSESLQELCGELCKELQIKRRVTLRQSSYFKSPMIFGLLRVYLLVPEGCDSAKELSFMLRHELTHLKHHDIWSRLLLWFVCALVS